MTEPHGLILAGGLGSRLLADGVSDPKPLIRLGGVPQIARLAHSLRAAGCGQVTCMARDDLAQRISATLQRLAPSTRVVPCRTPSSLHTLVAGLRATAALYTLCAMVDTFMAEDDWHALGQQTTRVQTGELDLLVAATPFAGNDPHPLFVELDGTARIQRIGETQSALMKSPSRPMVTGGIYFLGPAAQRLAGDCLNAGLSRMRSFLARAPRHLTVGAVEIERMIDIDHLDDLLAAETWLTRYTPAGHTLAEHHDSRSAPDAN